MKKTLFLSAILGAALCSSAFAETITVNGKTYNDVTIVTTATLDATPTSDYILIGGTTSTDNNQKNYKIQPGGNMGAWATELTGEQTIIIAPASTIVAEGEATSYDGYQTFFDAGGYAAQTINANIIAGGNDNVNLLRFWGGNGFTLNGDLTLVGNGVNVWNQASTHNLTGKLIASEGQTLKQTGSGILNLAQADLSAFSGTIKVEGGIVQVEASSVGIGYKSGSTLKYNAGAMDTEHSTIQFGATWTSSVTRTSDGRFAAMKNGNEVTLGSGSERELASVTTSGNNGGWLVVQGVGNTEEGIYTDIILNSTNNGLVIGVSGTAAHIGSLSGTSATAQIRGDWNGAGTDRELVVHQNSNTTFAGKFHWESGSFANRDVALTKEGSGTLTLTGANLSNKALTLNAGGVTFSGSGQWKGAINVNGGVLTFASALADSASIGAVTVGANGSIKFNASQFAANKAKFSSLTEGGTLILTGATGADGIDLSTAWSGSTIALNAVSGKLLGSATGDTTITQNIHLTNTTSAAAEWSAIEGGSYVFNGAITDDATQHGNMVFGAANKETSVTFNGSLAGWNSTVNNYSGFRVSNGTVNLTIGGDATGDDAVVSNTITVDSVSKPDNTNRNGKLNMTVARDAEFTGRIYANTLSVNAGMTVSATNSAVMVQDAIVLGDGANLTISAAGAQTTGALTLGSGATMTLGSAAEGGHNYNLTTSTLTVGGDSTLNANLVVSANGTMDFSSQSVLTMGCTVSIGNNVTVVLNSTEIAAIQSGQQLVLIDGVDGGSLAEAITIGSGILFVDENGASLNHLGLALQGVEYSTEHGSYAVVVTPEPATATLSLLALAALASRRRRH